MSLIVATYWWTPDQGSKFAAPYTADDVRRLAASVKKHLQVPHQFVCITDQPEAFPIEDDVVPISLDRTTHVPGTCFVRLMTFHPHDMFGGAEAMLQLDLDSLVVGNINHLVSRPDDLVLWRNPARIPWDNPTRPGRPYYNTSLLFHRLGTMPEVWNTFDRERPQAKDDQWYLSAIFGEHAATFDGQHDGVYRIARPGEPETGIWGEVPKNACIITMPGSEGKPSNPVIRAANPWLAEYGL